MKHNADIVTAFVVNMITTGSKILSGSFLKVLITGDSGRDVSLGADHAA